VVFEGLSMMIVQLESGVKRAESVTASHADALDGMIAQSEARLAGANSKLSPLQDAPDDASAHEVFGDISQGGLKSYGFEHRLPFAGVKPAVAPTPAATPEAPSTSGRFAR
jgi:hypothetical protein